MRLKRSDQVLRITKSHDEAGEQVEKASGGGGGASKKLPVY